jgi:hypothetical protein
MAKLRQPKQISEMSDEELKQYKEGGLESEGPADVIKPYKEKAAGDLEGQGHDILANVLRAAVPDSPFELRPSAAAMGKMGLRRAVANKVEEEKSAFSKLRRQGVDEAGNRTLDYGKMNRYTPETQAAANASARAKVPVAETLDYKNLGAAPKQEPMWKQKLNANSFDGNSSPGSALGSMPPPRNPDATPVPGSEVTEPNPAPPNAKGKVVLRKRVENDDAIPPEEISGSY